MDLLRCDILVILGSVYIAILASFSFTAKSVIKRKEVFFVAFSASEQWIESSVIATDSVIVLLIVCVIKDKVMYGRDL